MPTPFIFIHTIIRPAALMLLATAAFSSPAQAQDSELQKTPPPPPPYVGKLKGDFKFIKTYTYKTHQEKAAAAPGAPALPPDLQQLEAVQTGTTRRDRQRFVDGTSTEIWRSGPYRFLIYSFKPDYILGATVSPTGYEDTPDFKELDWIKAEDFQGEQILDKKIYYIYKAGDQTAVIEKTSLLPVSYESGLVKITFAYSSPTETLEMTPAMTKRMLEMKRAWSGR